MPLKRLGHHLYLTNYLCTLGTSNITRFLTSVGGSGVVTSIIIIQHNTVFYSRKSDRLIFARLVNQVKLLTARVLTYI